MTQIRKHYSPAFKSKVVQEVLAGDKSLSQIAAHYGIHPNMISKWKRAALQAMPAAFDEESQAQVHAQIAALQAQHEKEKDDLHAEIGRLTMQVNWLQKEIRQELPRSARRSLVERGHLDLPLSLQAHLLGVSRSSLSYRSVGPSEEEIALKHQIDAIFTAYPFYGSRRITEQLRREGWQINRKAVQRHMREMGLEPIAAGPNLE
jgi:putative transposase